jgi:hypothetical protein
MSTPLSRGTPSTSGSRSGGSQILLMDPSGNLVELFQPASR